MFVKVEAFFVNNIGGEEIPHLVNYNLNLMNVVGFCVDNGQNVVDLINGQKIRVKSLEPFERGE